MPLKEYEFAIAQSAAELAEVAQLRYEIHVDELGKRPENADHERRMLFEDLDSVAEILYVRKEGIVIATLRTLFGASAEIPAEYEEAYALERFREFPKSSFSFSSRLMIRPEHRRGRLLHAMLGRSYTEFRKKGVIFNFIGCSPSLVSMYEVLGYRRYRSGMFRTSLGNDFPLVVIADDRQHLAEVGSPWAPLSENFAAGENRTEWLRKNFPEYSGPTSCRVSGLDQFLDLLAQHVNLPEVDLFKGIRQEDLSLLLSASTIVDLKAGDHVVREGDYGAELYVVLDGSAEVRVRRPDNQPLVLESLGKGQIFGEMAFITSQPRSADIVCTSDSRLLAVNRAYLERSIESTPAAVSRLLLNLTQLLIEKVSLGRNMLITSKI